MRISTPDVLEMMAVAAIVLGALLLMLVIMAVGRLLGFIVSSTTVAAGKAIKIVTSTLGSHAIAITTHTSRHHSRRRHHHTHTHHAPRSSSCSSSPPTRGLRIEAGPRYKVEDRERQARSRDPAAYTPEPISLPPPRRPLECRGSIELPSWVAGSIEGVDLHGATCCLLGCGGWGCVYKCSRHGEEYALKLSKPLVRAIEEGEPLPTMGPGSTPNEASWLRGLNHPNLVKVLGYSRVIPAAVYEYAEDGSLRRWIPGPGLGEATVVRAAIHIANGLRYLHSRGLVHGDVKPENVLVHRGVLKLGDYSGVRNLLVEVERASMGPSVAIHCTPGYCAPEQVYADLAREARRLGLENRVDVYQLGVLILEASTGRVLDGSRRVGMDRSELESMLSGLSPGLSSLLAEMLAEEPWARPSMDEVLRRLSRLL